MKPLVSPVVVKVGSGTGTAVMWPVPLHADIGARVDRGVRVFMKAYGAKAAPPRRR